MADYNNYDRLPEESLADLRYKYLRARPLYGRAPTKAAYPSLKAVKVSKTAPKITYGPRRFVDFIMALFSFLFALIIICAPISHATGTPNSFSTGMTYNAFNFYFGSESVFNKLDGFSSVNSIMIVAAAVTLGLAIYGIVPNAIVAISSFFKKTSDNVRVAYVNILTTVFAYHAFLALYSREQPMGDTSFYGFAPSEVFSSLAVIAAVATAIGAIVSYAKGFRNRSSKKAAWWSSVILTGLYSVIAVTISKLNLFGLFKSMNYALELEDGGYSATNSGFEMFLILLFNVFIVFGFYKILNNAKTCLSGELNCLLGFAVSGIKMAPTPKSRLKSAIWPALMLVAASILGNGETGIGWSIVGFNGALAVVTATTLAIWIACIVLNKKTRHVFY